jgi:DNA-binding Lrp family transcriptional regulator
MDESDARLLTRIQARLPIEPRPFERLGHELGMTEREVLDRVRRLSQSGVIRRIGATFHPERLGYVSTLAAMQVDADRIEAVAAAACRFAEVTHCYERDGQWNLWFTITAESPERLEAVLDAVRAQAPGCPVVSLPSRRRYKLRVEFDLEQAADGPEQNAAPPLRQRGGSLEEC